MDCVFTEKFEVLTYSSAPVCMGNTFQELLRLLVTADNVERLILEPLVTWG
jgi:hypothetical protein